MNKQASFLNTVVFCVCTLPQLTYLGTLALAFCTSAGCLPRNGHPYQSSYLGTYLRAGTYPGYYSVSTHSKKKVHGQVVFTMDSDYAGV